MDCELDADYEVVREIPDCHLCPNEAVYEGWARKIDPFTQQRTGMNIRIPVCEDHKPVLIGAQKENPS